MVSWYLGALTAHCDHGGKCNLAPSSPSLQRVGSLRGQSSNAFVPHPLHIHGRALEDIIVADRVGSLSSASGTSYYQSVGHGIWAGGVAGVIAETLMHPFDTISVRQKCQGVSSSAAQGAKYLGMVGTARMMIREEGALSLMNGVSATILSAAPSSALYFGTYEVTKCAGLKFVENLDPNGVFGKVDNVYKADFVHLFAGVCSELCASLIVVPSEVVKSRMQLGGNAYRGFTHGLVSIMRSEGTSGLFSGYRACLLQDCMFSALQFLLYERLRRDFKSDKVSRSSESATTGDRTLEELVDAVEDTAEDLLAGAVAGGISVFVTNPLDVACARLMTQNWTKPANEFVYSGTFDCLAKVARTEGIRGLWSGAVARTVSVAPLCAVTFGIYEKMKTFIKNYE